MGPHDSPEPWGFFVGRTGRSRDHVGRAAGQPRHPAAPGRILPVSRGLSTTATSVEIRDLRREDWPDVARIYAAGIATGNATFEEEVPSWEEWDAGHLEAHRYVAADGGQIVGWVALRPYSRRDCYDGVADVSIYVDPAVRGRGFGRALLGHAVDESEKAGIWTLQAGVFAENSSSLVLHLHCGFRLVGVRERIGQLDGVWRDVMLLERRAAI